MVCVSFKQSGMHSVHPAEGNGDKPDCYQVFARLRCGSALHYRFAVLSVPDSWIRGPIPIQLATVSAPDYAADLRP